MPFDSSPPKDLTLTDDDLVQGYRRGDKTATESLVNRHQSRLYRFIRYRLHISRCHDRDAVNEICNSSWVTVFEKCLKGYIPQGKFGSYLIGAGKYKLKEYLRGYWKHSKAAEDFDEEKHTDGAFGEGKRLGSQEQSAELAAIRDYLDSLPSHLGQACYAWSMFYLEGSTDKEISNFLGVAKITARRYRKELHQKILRRFNETI